MIGKNNGFTELLDSAFVVAGEMIPGKGEDCYYLGLSEDFGFVGVFDGCGGIGSRKYPNFDNKSGAYIASRACANKAREWFSDFCARGVDFEPQNVSDISHDLKEEFLAALKKYEDNAASSVIKGSLSKSFPTTASIILFRQMADEVFTAYLWAGDSRGFVLNEKGLCQITEDDVEGEEDAFSNLSNDGRLSNMVNAGENFKLHAEARSFKAPVILITATDGCFGYFSTPMEFEQVLLATMLKADSVEQWQALLREVILKFTGDDYTIGIATFGYGSFKNMKKAYLDRYKFLVSEYIDKLNGASKEVMNDLWEKYKTGYYRSK